MQIFYHNFPKILCVLTCEILCKIIYFLKVEWYNTQEDFFLHKEYKNDRNSQ